MLLNTISCYISSFLTSLITLIPILSHLFKETPKDDKNEDKKWNENSISIDLIFCHPTINVGIFHVLK